MNKKLGGNHDFKNEIDDSGKISLLEYEVRGRFGNRVYAMSKDEWDRTRAFFVPVFEKSDVEWDMAVPVTLELFNDNDKVLDILIRDRPPSLWEKFRRVGRRIYYKSPAWYQSLWERIIGFDGRYRAYNDIVFEAIHDHLPMIDAELAKYERDMDYHKIVTINV